MAIYQEETLLILTKTYPSPSRKYRETSCVAAVNLAGDLRRLFPIPFRLLDDDHQFSKWQWIKAKVTKAMDDHRPESYKVDVDSIQLLSKIDTKKAWSERIQRISPHLVSNFTSLETRRQEEGWTLGFFRPLSYELEIKEADNIEWTDEEKEKLLQDNLFDLGITKKRIPLRKVPFDFHYRYIDEIGHEHRHKITDWEACALFWNCQRNYGNNWEKYFRSRLQDYFSTKCDLIFMMGTMHRFPDKWLIVGLVYPPKVDARQEPLFFLGPND